VDERFEEHLRHPRGRGPSPPGAHDGAAGGAACGDLVRISLRVEGDRIARATFDASGCGAALAAASATVERVEGAHVLDAAKVGAPAIAAELGGLSPGKLHAADLAADALHRALGEAVRADAAVALSALNEAFRVRFGRDLCLVDSYRSISSQYAVKASRGYLAATPGTSMHGWGLAIDLCGDEYRSSEVYGWLWENGPAYGWENPPWAQRGGMGNYEPWHFEYKPGVVEITTWH